MATHISRRWSWFIIGIIAGISIFTLPGTVEPREASRFMGTRCDDDQARADCPSERVSRPIVPARSTHRRPTIRPPSHSERSARSHRAARQRSLYRRVTRAGFPLTQPPQSLLLLDSWLIRPIDGDTFGYGVNRIRINGLDAPELSESGGFEASQRLGQLLQEGSVTILAIGLDTFGRIVADVFVDGVNVAHTMRAGGYGKGQ